MKQSPASAVKLRSFVTLNRAARLKQHMGRSGYHSVATADPDLDWWVLLCYWLVKPMTGLRPEIIYTFWSRITASASLSRWITLMKAMKDIFRRVSANKTSYSDQKFYSWNVLLCLSRPKRVFQAKAFKLLFTLTRCFLCLNLTRRYRQRRNCQHLFWGCNNNMRQCFFFSSLHVIRVSPVFHPDYFQTAKCITWPIQWVQY